MAFYERQFPDIRITNLQQVFAGTVTPYSERWHHKFLAFGKHAGFKSSFFEVLPSLALGKALVEITLSGCKTFNFTRNFWE